MVVNIPRTYGALLMGGFFAIALSGIVTAQAFVYHKLYKTDLCRIKVLVLTIWLLDLLHTSLVCASIWDYTIVNFGNASYIGHIHWTVAATKVVCTAVLTFLVHLFFVHRIYRLNKDNWQLAIPITILAFFRLCSACVTSGEMIVLQEFVVFVDNFKARSSSTLSSTVDVLITGSLLYLFGTSRTGSSALNRIIDTLMLYAFENGALTRASTIVSMICWLMMPHNLIFMGIHFVIGKLYANSLLIMLNTRRQIRDCRSPFSSPGFASNALPPINQSDFPIHRPNFVFRSARISDTHGDPRMNEMEITSVGTTSNLEHDPTKPAVSDMAITTDIDESMLGLKVEFDFEKQPQAIAS